MTMPQKDLGMLIAPIFLAGRAMKINILILSMYNFMRLKVLVAALATKMRLVIQVKLRHLALQIVVHRRLLLPSLGSTRVIIAGIYLSGHAAEHRVMALIFQLQQDFKMGNLIIFQ